MNIVIVDKKDTNLTYQSKLLIVDGAKIPFRLIDTLIVASNVKLNAKLLIALTKEDITILFVNYKNQASIVNKTTSKNSELKLHQYKSTLNPLPIAKDILIEKILSHKAQLNQHNIDIEVKDTLTQIEEAQDLSTLLGIEGSFSKLYFKHYFQLIPKTLHSNIRTKRPPKDPLNAMLSFYYTLFYQLITIRLLSFGFEPSIGFLHRPFREHNALASDILELFRANINQEILELFANKKLKKSDFSKRDSAVYLRYEARKEIWKEFKSFYQEQEAQIDKFISKIRSKIYENK